jgi:hypothetical protein
MSFGGLAASFATLLSVALVAGCGGGGSSSSSTVTTAPRVGSTSAARAATATTHPGKAQSHPTQVKATKAASKGASAPVGGHLLRSYAGSGNARLGTIVVSSPAVLVWRAQHPAIQIFTEQGFILVSSHASGGSVELTRGSFSGTRVATRGAWSIELRTRS